MKTFLPVSFDRALAWASILVGGLFSLWVLTIATIDSLPSFVGLLGVMAWVAFPYLTLAHASERLSRSWISRVLISLGVAGCAAFGMRAFSFVDEDAQGGLVVFIAPFYQLLGAGTIYVIVAIAEMIQRRVSTSH